VKRFLREAFRRSRGKLPVGFDFVAIASESACNADFHAIESDFADLALEVVGKWGGLSPER